MDSPQSQQQQQLQQQQQQQQQPVVKKKETRGRKPKPKEEKKDEQQAKKMKAHQQPSVDERYTQWKSLVPVLYDWFANHNLVWPSLSCRYSTYSSFCFQLSALLCLLLSFLGFSVCCFFHLCFLCFFLFVGDKSPPLY